MKLVIRNNHSVAQILNKIPDIPKNGTNNWFFLMFIPNFNWVQYFLGIFFYTKILAFFTPKIFIFFTPEFLLFLHQNFYFLLHQFFYTKKFAFFYTKFWNLEKDFLEKKWYKKIGVKQISKTRATIF